MTRRVTLIRLLDQLRAEARLSKNPAHNSQVRDTHVDMLQRIQDRLWDDFDWPHLRVERLEIVQSGQRFYAPPADMLIDNIEKIELYDGGGWRPLVAWHRRSSLFRAQQRSGRAQLAADVLEDPRGRADRNLADRRPERQIRIRWRVISNSPALVTSSRWSRTRTGPISTTICWSCMPLPRFLPRAGAKDAQIKLDQANHFLSAAALRSDAEEALHYSALAGPYRSRGSMLFSTSEVVRYRLRQDRQDRRGSVVRSGRRAPVLRRPIRIRLLAICISMRRPETCIATPTASGPGARSDGVGSWRANIKGPPGAASTVPGPPGPQGLAGPTGPAGADSTVPGPAGAIGATGSQGPQGPQGPQGIKGDTGLTGSQGPQGSIGPQGSQGIKGDTGLTGSQGPQGNPGATGGVGPQGPQGNPGATGAASTVPGPQGPVGATGATGGQIMYIGDGPPASPVVGQTWFESRTPETALSTTKTPVARQRSGCRAMSEPSAAAGWN